MITIMTQRTEAHGKELATEAMEKMSNSTVQPSAEAIASMKAELGMKAMLEGINDAFLISVGIIALALILAAFMKRAIPPKEQQQETSPESLKKAVE